MICPKSFHRYNWPSTGCLFAHKMKLISACKGFHKIWESTAANFEGKPGSWVAKTKQSVHLSISSTFYGRIFCTNVLFSPKRTEKSCAKHLRFLAPKFSTTNVCVKRWWNRRQICLISTNIRNKVRFWHIIESVIFVLLSFTELKLACRSTFRLDLHQILFLSIPYPQNTLDKKEEKKDPLLF